LFWLANFIKFNVILAGREEFYSRHDGNMAIEMTATTPAFLYAAVENIHRVHSLSPTGIAAML
jgi:hypothetical protein